MEISTEVLHRTAQGRPESSVERGPKTIRSRTGVPIHGEKCFNNLTRGEGSRQGRSIDRKERVQSREVEGPQDGSRCAKQLTVEIVQNVGFPIM